MSTRSSHRRVAACACGEVRFETVGAPILTAICCCESCQTASHLFELAGALPVLNSEGGTGFILQRKDRLRCAQGAGRLQDHRLKPDSPTRRVLASCCNTPMFLEFTKGHWLSLYRDRFADDAPPPEMRVMTGDLPKGVRLSDDMPNYASHSGRFMWKLLSAWAAMGFRVPKAVNGLESRR